MERQCDRSHVKRHSQDGPKYCEVCGVLRTDPYADAMSTQTAGGLTTLMGFSGLAGSVEWNGEQYLANGVKCGPSVHGVMEWIEKQCPFVLSFTRLGFFEAIVYRFATLDAARGYAHDRSSGWRSWTILDLNGGQKTVVEQWTRANMFTPPVPW